MGVHVPHPGHSSISASEFVRAKFKRLCQLVGRTERAMSENQRLAEKFLVLRLGRLGATPRERERHVVRREQRVRVLCAEQAGSLDEALALDRHGLGVLALL